jgi:hypothetical protein
MSAPNIEGTANPGSVLVGGSNGNQPAQVVGYTTAAAPVYVKGGIYFDTTLNKLRIGGATAWETVTSV